MQGIPTRRTDRLPVCLKLSHSLGLGYKDPIFCHPIYPTIWHWCHLQLRQISAALVKAIPVRKQKTPATMTAMWTLIETHCWLRGTPAAWTLDRWPTPQPPLLSQCHPTQYQIPSHLYHCVPAPTQTKITCCTRGHSCLQNSRPERSKDQIANRKQEKRRIQNKALRCTINLNPDA